MCINGRTIEVHYKGLPTQTKITSIDKKIVMYETFLNRLCQYIVVCLKRSNHLL